MLFWFDHLQNYPVYIQLIMVTLCVVCTKVHSIRTCLLLKTRLLILNTYFFKFVYIATEGTSRL